MKLESNNNIGGKALPLGHFVFGTKQFLNESRNTH